MECSWTKKETLYIYAYLFRYPLATDETIAQLLLRDEWITNKTKNELIKRIQLQRKQHIF